MNQGRDIVEFAVAEGTDFPPGWLVEVLLEHPYFGSDEEEPVILTLGFI